jgi:hypothetical protein
MARWSSRACHAGFNRGGRQCRVCMEVHAWKATQAAARCCRTIVSARPNGALRLSPSMPRCSLDRALVGSRNRGRSRCCQEPRGDRNLRHPSDPRPHRAVEPRLLESAANPLDEFQWHSAIFSHSALGHCSRSRNMRRSCSSTRSIARSCSGRSGSSGGVRCSRQTEWVMRSGVGAFHAVGAASLRAQKSAGPRAGAADYNT